MSPDRGLFALMGGAAPAWPLLLALSPLQQHSLTDQTQDTRPTATSAPLPAPTTGTGEGLRSGSPGLGRQCQGPAVWPCRSRFGQEDKASWTVAF